MNKNPEHQHQNPETLRRRLIGRVAGEAQRLNDEGRVIKIPLTLDTMAHMIIGRVDASLTPDGVARQVMASSLVNPGEPHVAVTVMPISERGPIAFSSVEHHQALEVTTGLHLTYEYLNELAALCDNADFDNPEPYSVVEQRAAAGRYATWQTIHLDSSPVFVQ